VAGTLLLIFLAQCAWLVNRSRLVKPEAHEIFRIHEGLGQWRGEWIASTPSAARTQQSVGDEPYDSHHSALWYLIASAPSLLWPRNTANYPYWGWLAHAPYLIFGVLLGASLWYVARRLYGNVGGYIALMLYCFSPGVVRSSALWFAEPEIGATWGAFGAIFTAIAVAHTLYAPRPLFWKHSPAADGRSAIAVCRRYAALSGTGLPACRGPVLVCLCLWNRGRPARERA